MMQILFFLKSNDCRYPNFERVYISTLLKYNFKFTPNENLLFSFDDLVDSNNLSIAIQCSLEKNNVISLINDFTGYILKYDTIYYFPASDYNYGLVSINSENRIKLTFIPNLFGNIELQEIFIVKISEDYKWYYYDFSENRFIQNNEKCLRCHMSRNMNSFMFDQANYKKVRH